MAFEYLANIPAQVAANLEVGQRTQAQAQANQKSERELWREMKLKSILSKHRDEKGRINELAALDEAKRADLVPELRSAIYGAEAAEMGQRADIAQNRALLEQMGAPSQVGVSIPERSTQAPMPQPFGAELDTTGFTTPDMAQPAQPTPKIGPGGIAPNEVNVSASLPEMPQPEMMTVLGAPRGNITEALDYKPKSVSDMMGSVTGGHVFPEDGGAELEWSPQDDATAFRQYGKSLASEAKATGIEPKEMLRKIRDDAAAKVLKPLPNPFLATRGGPEGLVKYTQQVAERALSEQQARAAGSKAVADYRAGLVGKAKEFGASTQADEKFEADMGGRRAGSASGDVYRTRAVSDTEKTQGETVAKAYQDLSSAEKRGGFEGDYSAAMARAKADGNVNEDAIVGHLVGMGAWPSDQAIALKNLMRESSGSAVGDIYKMAKVKIGDLYMSNPGRREAWYKDSRDNMRGAMQLSGYDIAPTRAEINKMSPKDAKAALEKMHQKKRGEKAPAEQNETAIPGYTKGADGVWRKSK